MPGSVRLTTPLSQLKVLSADQALRHLCYIVQDMAAPSPLFSHESTLVDRDAEITIFGEVPSSTMKILARLADEHSALEFVPALVAAGGPIQALLLTIRPRLCKPVYVWNVKFRHFASNSARSSHLWWDAIQDVAPEDHWLGSVETTSHQHKPPSSCPCGALLLGQNESECRSIECKESKNGRISIEKVIALITNNILPMMRTASTGRLCIGVSDLSTKSTLFSLPPGHSGQDFLDEVRFGLDRFFAGVVPCLPSDSACPLSERLWRRFEPSLLCAAFLLPVRTRSHLHPGVASPAPQLGPTTRLLDQNTLYHPAAADGYPPPPRATAAVHLCAACQSVQHCMQTGHRHLHTTTVPPICGECRHTAARHVCHQCHGRP
eukprot:m.77799 g.77799  ORF g.77799 m.77799 type:complete len:378 (+) comp7930_c0_seq3:1046-2179(+)